MKLMAIAVYLPALTGIRTRDPGFVRQNHIFEWVQDHRLHHRYSETDADPHNATRGFFFAHIGWLFVAKHPESVAREKSTDMSDMLADPVVVFQKRHYYVLAALLCFVIPTMVPVLLWHERPLTALLVCGILRYVCTLHSTWLVNSAAHLWGRRPYDRFINPAENPMVAMAALGEGWHNYHHSFPWDYRTAELGGGTRNLTTSFIDLMAWIGWAYDRKTVSQDMVTLRAQRKGDGSYRPKEQ
ncbi:acyl-CoA Delta-9 desaturase-like [Amphibalanus amphitrite]|uniref:acyl-CoA Delta-9 desaturase-like n=1 Tax=Amphibalanus amphitrite TaxID=1232801 RepID=UPI001C91D50C|nr:acyl-CoA Delta-9 desaturase-like [Amphibalanus amphitrite]